MKITILSKPEKKASAKGTTYYSLKVRDENLTEKSGNYFGDTEPEIDSELEVDEKFNEEYKSYTWFAKKDKKPGFQNNFTPKPSMSIDTQIRVVALQEANKTYHELTDKAGIKVGIIAKIYEQYLKTGE